MAGPPSLDVPMIFEDQRARRKSRRSSLCMNEGDATMTVLKSGIENFHRHRHNDRVTLADLSESDRMELDNTWKLLLAKNSEVLTLDRLKLAAELVLGPGNYSVGCLEKGLKAMDSSHNGQVGWIEYRAFMSKNWNVTTSVAAVLSEETDRGKTIFVDTAQKTRLVDMIKAYRRRTMMERMLQEAHKDLQVYKKTHNEDGEIIVEKAAGVERSGKSLTLVDRSGRSLTMDFSKRGGSCQIKVALASCIVTLVAPSQAKVALASCIVTSVAPSQAKAAHSSTKPVYPSYPCTPSRTRRASQGLMPSQAKVALASCIVTPRRASQVNMPSQNNSGHLNRLMSRTGSLENSLNPTWGMALGIGGIQDLAGPPAGQPRLPVLRSPAAKEPAMAIEGSQGATSRMGRLMQRLFKKGPSQLPDLPGELFKASPQPPSTQPPHQTSQQQPSAQDSQRKEETAPGNDASQKPKRHGPSNIAPRGGGARGGSGFKVAPPPHPKNKAAPPFLPSILKS
eukprot:gene30159-35139_t